MADEKNTPPEQDDWLADFEEMPEEPVDEIDQASIDALLGGSDDDQETDRQEPGDSSEEMGSAEIDQSAIDALLNGDDESEPAAAAAAAEEAEIDQAAIDALLSGDDEEMEPPPEASAADQKQTNGEEMDFDQNSIDALLNSPEEAPTGAEAAVSAEGSLDSFLEGLDEDAFQAALEEDDGVPNQEDIDELFSQGQENPNSGGGAVPEEIDFAELMGDAEDTMGTFGMAEDGTEGGDEHRDLGDEPTLDEDIFEEETIADQMTAAGHQGEPAGGKNSRRSFLPLHLLPAQLQNRTTAGIGAGLVLVLGIGFAWFGLSAPEPAEEPALAALESPNSEAPSAALLQAKAPPTAPEPPANQPPRAAGGEYRMNDSGGEVSILLLAQDENGDSLRFEITEPPAHGRLSGKLPAPIYLPNKDFPGEDRFVFRASDGQDASEPATVTITGPVLASPENPAEKEKVATIVPKNPVLTAADVALKARSTEPVTIDWRQIWGQTNPSPFDPEKITILVEEQKLHGTLTRLSPTRHQYQPERFFSGRDTIRYRFKMAGLTSKPGRLELQVELGDHPPQLLLEPLAKSEFQVGETVLLDASGSKDEAPGQLTFAWSQLAGPPVMLHILDEQGAVVSFVVPSSFYAAADQGPVLRVTAMDPAGQQDSRDVKISTVSRYQSALWQGGRLPAPALPVSPPSGADDSRGPLPWPSAGK